MKYFQHESNARNDVKMKRLRRKFGIVGYGVYFVMLEIIAENVKTDNQQEWGYVDKAYDVEDLADEAQIDPEKLREILQYCNELDLFQKKDEKLFCKQILKRLDEYSQVVQRNVARRGKLGKKVTTPDQLPTNSGKKRVEENRIKEKRIEENISIASNDEISEDFEDPKTYTDEPLVEFCRETQKIEKRFVNYGKQLQALKRIRDAGYTDDEDIKFVIEEMAVETFWKENPFDMNQVADNMHKYLNRYVDLRKKGSKKHQRY